MGLKEFFTGYKGKDIPKELKDFNWGAFLLTFIWGIKFKAWVTFLVIPLVWFQFPFGLNWLFLIILQFYCGIKGNEWAYQVDWWKTPADFRRTQTRWAIAAVLVHILVPLVIISVLTLFVKKSPDNPRQFARNFQCTIAYNNIKKGLKHTELTPSSTNSQLALSFGKNFKDVEIDDGAVVFKSHDSNFYRVNFEKENDAICSLEQQNCLIKSSYVVPNEMMLFKDCEFYFDNAKNVKPADNTKEALKKGINIFKYL